LMRLVLVGGEKDRLFGRSFLGGAREDRERERRPGETGD
jgi:hypothetical protein